jgi:hypothetical protein
MFGSTSNIVFTTRDTLVDLPESTNGDNVTSSAHDVFFQHMSQLREEKNGQLEQSTTELNQLMSNDPSGNLNEVNETLRDITGRNSEIAAINRITIKAHSVEKSLFGVLKNSRF